MTPADSAPAEPPAGFFSLLKDRDFVTRGLALLPAALAVVVIFDQWYLWSTKEDYMFGYAVPVFSIFVIYDRWDKISAWFRGEGAADAGRPASKILEWCFAAGAFFSLFCFFGGGLARAVFGPGILMTFFNTFGFCGVAIGCLWWISEKTSSGKIRPAGERFRLLEIFTFPVLVWLISGPFLYLVDSQVKFILLEEVTKLVVTLLNAADYGLRYEGNVILLPNPGPNGQPDTVGVADACSGIRSLSTCVFCGAFISAIFITGRIRKFTMLALSAGGAIFLNVIRVAFLTVWASDHGSVSLDYDFTGNAPNTPGFAVGTVHDIVGYVAMGVTFALLAGLTPLVNLRIKKPDAPAAPV